MKRIATANRAVDLFGAGKDGFRAAVAGVADATYLSALWFNHVQEAVVRLREAAGVAVPADNDFDWMVTSVGRLIAARVNGYVQDAGVPNAYIATNSPALSAPDLVTGLMQRVSILNTNTGPATYAPDGLPSKPVYGMGGAALQGGELVAKGIAVFMYVVAPNVNAGAGGWLLIECTGGAVPVGTATQSNHAAQYGQLVTSGGFAGFKNLVGFNDATTPLTKYTIKSARTTYELVGGGTLTDNGGTYTADIALAGPVLNGRDQAAAFPTSSWLYLHAITNGTTKGAIWSLSDTVPTLPAGYTGSALAIAAYLNPTGQLITMRVFGKVHRFSNSISVLSAWGTPGATGDISLATVMPPNAQSAILNPYGYCLAPGTPLAAICSINIDGLAYSGSYPTQTGNDYGSWGWESEIPNVNRLFNWYIAAGMSFYNCNVTCRGFTLSNGAR